jgi:hypothetical protein
VVVTLTLIVPSGFILMRVLRSSALSVSSMLFFRYTRCRSKRCTSSSRTVRLPRMALNTSAGV